MSQRGQFSFYPVNSTEPAFNSSAGSTTVSFALESTATNRVWQGPSGRAIRLSSKAADDYSVAFGTSDVVCVSSACILMLGGTVETFMARANWTHMAIAASTDVFVNCTIGYGQ